MIITTGAELKGMRRVSEVVGVALREMRAYAKPGTASWTRPNLNSDHY